MNLISYNLVTNFKVAIEIMPWVKWGGLVFIAGVGAVQWWRRWVWRWDSGITRTPRYFKAGPRQYGWYYVWLNSWWRQVVRPVSPEFAPVTPGIPVHAGDVIALPDI